MNFIKNYIDMKWEYVDNNLESLLPISWPVKIRSCMV